MNHSFLCSSLLMLIPVFALSQGSPPSPGGSAEHPAAPAAASAAHRLARANDWWQADPQKDSIPCISLDEAYDLLKGRRSTPVIVAVLDFCIDTAHEDLKHVIWTNPKEIAGNGADDDHNGYVDDVHGWCFVCGPNNVAQNAESTDEVRTYLTWRSQFENIDTTTLTGSVKIQYAMYRLAKQKLSEAYRLSALGKILQADTIRFMQYLNSLSVTYKDSNLAHIPFASLPYTQSYDSTANVLWSILMGKNGRNARSPTLGRFIGFLKKPGTLNDIFFGKIVGIDSEDTTKNYRLVVGDDDHDFTTPYGAPTIKVKEHGDEHATLIAGIIAADRKNGLGIKGIADNVLIMPVVIGNSPTRDKDVVFGIHYAVDNGAAIISLSLGGTPSLGEHVKEIMEAFDYASRHGVLIVNSAGNEGTDMDKESYNFGQGIQGKEHDEYIRVGANAMFLNDSLVSVFSNYGKQSVDLFAPGSAIYTTAPGSKYEAVDGTSFSAPIVAGVAALLKSYFPALTARQLKEILVQSVYHPDPLVTLPFNSGINTKLPFRQLSKSSGIVNACNAVKMADKMFARSGAMQPGKPFGQPPHDWWQADPIKDSIPGISLQKARDLLKGRKSTPVIVAIIDNCIDTANDALKTSIWTNTKEIPGNGIDDDHNGYVDDIHGWCFIANKSGAIQDKQSSNELIIYQAWEAAFEGMDSSRLTGVARIQYDMYQTAKGMLLEKYRFYTLGKTLQADSLKFIRYVEKLIPGYQDRKLQDIPFLTLPVTDPYDSAANAFFNILTKQRLPSIPTGGFYGRLQHYPGFQNLLFSTLVFRDQYQYDSTAHYRSIIGDDPDDFKDKNYGSPVIDPPGIGGDHATFIAGIIGAKQQDTAGISGIADNVLFMPLVTSVPNGGSITKDIVMAVHYAVDNGASVINMSFNEMPWINEHEKEMREAFDYAARHDVVIVNGAGNDGLDLDHEKYLLGMGSQGKEQDNYIRVGGTTYLWKDSLVWTFSQYGQKTVDLFAPGYQIYSTLPGNKFDSKSGTSFACPMVTGVAALLRSYYPHLSAKQVKEILIKSSYKPDVLVIPPGKAGGDGVPFRQLSKSGGIVNAYAAVKMAGNYDQAKH